MKKLYFRNILPESGATNGVIYRVNRIVGYDESANTLHPSMFARLPVFAVNTKDGSGELSFWLNEAGIYEVVEEYWSGSTEQVTCRTYAYYCLRYDEELDELSPNDILDAIDATPYFKVVQFAGGATGRCIWEV